MLQQMNTGKIKQMAVTFLAVSVLFFAGINWFIRSAKFGRLPGGERKARIEKSANYRNGAFQNLSPTPQMTNEGGMFNVLKDFRTAKNRRPPAKLPSVKTDLKNISEKENVLVWFGHSSYFMQIDGKTFLVDPVFSGNASPMPFMIKAFDGSDIYAAEDFPAIDFLVITHDHWDHLDYKTVKTLKPKVRKVITGLGTGAHLERWGFEPEIVIENDWGDSVQFEGGITFYTTPTRHFSGRSTKPNQTLWASFVLETPSMRIFIGGDGGYDEHFAEIGRRFGSFDIAFLENGQYNESWKYIHMMPEQVLQAARDLNTKRLFPVHSMKFALAIHSWDTPLKKITGLNKAVGLNLVTPKIGEPVNMKDTSKIFDEWWTELK